MKHAGWGARPRNRRDWITKLRPISTGGSYINREWKRRRMMKLVQVWRCPWLLATQLKWSHRTVNYVWGTLEHPAINDPDIRVARAL